MALLFENITCSRCSGTGNYSYCQMYGTRCFKCHGSKVVLTKRGALAQRYLDQLQTVSLTALQVGAVIQVHGITHGGQSYSYKGTVTAIESTDQTCTWGKTDNGITTTGVTKYVCIKTSHAKMGDHETLMCVDTQFRIWPNTAENITKALAYQESLTKTGTVRKSKIQVESPKV
jgi:hypothetical protein